MEERKRTERGVTKMNYGRRWKSRLMLEKEEVVLGRVKDGICRRN